MKQDENLLTANSNLIVYTTWQHLESMITDWMCNKW